MNFSYLYAAVELPVIKKWRFLSVKILEFVVMKLQFYTIAYNKWKKMQF